MFVLRSVQAENITSCNGVVHLPAGRHTLVAFDNCLDCQIVGEPGTVLDGPVVCHGRLTLNGSVEVQGHSQSQCLTISNPGGGGGEYASMSVHGNVSFKDCHGAKFGSALMIMGPNSDEDMVSFTNCSGFELTEAIFISKGARVRFTDFESTFRSQYGRMDISDSHVIFDRAMFFFENSGYSFWNSTIIASNTTFGAGHVRSQGSFGTWKSVLNFTNSSVSIEASDFGPTISIGNSSVDATCPSNSPVFTQRHDLTHGGRDHSHGGMDIDDSTVRFGQCSCHLDHAISVAGPLSVRKGSVTFSKCQTYGGSTKVDPVVVVV